MQRRKPKNEKHEMEVEIDKVVKAQKEAQSTAKVADREETNCTQQRKQDNEQQASYAKEYVAKVEAEFQKICDGILALMDKNFIPSAAEGHQQGTLKISSNLSKSILNRSQRSNRQHRKPRTTRIFRSRVVCPRMHSTT